MHSLTVFSFTVSGDNANTLVDTSEKGFREGKEQNAKLKTTTPSTTTTTNAVTDVSPEPSDDEIKTTTVEALEDALVNEAYDEGELDIRLGNITHLNESNARGIMSNLVKAVNKCKYLSF